MDKHETGAKHSGIRKHHRLNSHRLAPNANYSSAQEKEYKVLTEVMTEMFQQCGLLIEPDIMEMDNYQDFLKVLQHHIFMGNVSTIPLTHFIILMVYMSFCKLNHYTQYMTDKEAVLLKEAVQMTLVIMAFRASFSMKGGHNTINPYLKNIPSEVRRNVHIITSRYMEQECTCQNHVQCDIHPTLLTSQVVLPSYQHFLQHLQLTGMTKKLFFLLLIYLMVSRPWLNPRCLNYCVNYP